MNVLLPTCLVGSYAQPDWLIDRARLDERLPAQQHGAQTRHRPRRTEHLN